jgi:hypothetical protein
VPYYGWWGPDGAWDNAFGWAGRYGPEDDWGALWYPYRGWRGPPVAGVIHNQSPTGLTHCYLGQGLFFDVSSREQEKIPETSRRIALAVSGVLCMRLRLAAFCFARVALRT